jgi:hypothetical protein
MAYTQSAERYARGATPATAKPGCTLPEGWCLFDDVYSEIADATPIEGVWRLTGLVGRIPAIAHYAPRFQADILRVVIRDMRTLPPEADRVRRHAGGYVWVWGTEPAADAEPASAALEATGSTT